MIYISVLNVCRNNLHHKSRWFSNIRVFHDVVVGLNIRAGVSVGTKIFVEDHDGSTQRGNRST